jgi:prepilin-type N-terminal cleavage/methylation domain-containing protein/prepilin-type processing-associated H-X9-DG protein
MTALPEQIHVRRHGFTLVELLTVIAIIALLAAMLFPAFASARAKARDANCLSNLKQIGMALKLYGADWGEFLPLANNRPSEQGGPGIAEVLSSHARSTKIFRCPADVDDKWMPVSRGGEGTSYDYALGMLNIGMPMQRMDRPWNMENSECPLMSDFSESWHTGGANVLFADGHAKNILR